MQGNKDGSFPELLKKPQVSPNTSTPNILKKRLSFDPAIHSSNECYKPVEAVHSKQSADAAASLRFLNSAHNKVDVLVLNQEDFMDIPLKTKGTGYQTLEIAGDSAGASMQEIVVDKTQIFQLQKVPPAFINFPAQAVTNARGTLQTTQSFQKILPTGNTAKTQNIGNTPPAVQNVMTAPFPNFVVALPKIQNVMVPLPIAQNLVFTSPNVVQNVIKTSPVQNVNKTSAAFNNVLKTSPFKNYVQKPSPIIRYVKRKSSAVQNIEETSNVHNVKQTSSVQNVEKPLPGVQNVKNTLPVNHNFKKPFPAVQNVKKTSPVFQNIEKTVPVGQNMKKAVTPVQNVQKSLHAKPLAVQKPSPIVQNVKAGSPVVQNIGKPLLTLQKVKKTPPVENVTKTLPVRDVKNTPQVVEEPSPAVENEITADDTAMDVVTIEDDMEERVLDISRDSEAPAVTESASSTLAISICRTCLKPVPLSDAHKLYDVGANHRASYELRKKLVEVCESIDLQASLNPVICQDCCDAINSAYKLRKQVKTIEDLISTKKRGTITVVDLRSVLVEAALGKLGKRTATSKTRNSNKTTNDTTSSEPTEVDLEQYLEKRKRIIDQYVTSLKDCDSSSIEQLEKPSDVSDSASSKDNVPAENGSELDLNAEPVESNTTSDSSTQDLSKSNNNAPSVIILEDLLLRNSYGDNIIEIVNEDEECADTPPNLESSVPAFEPDPDEPVLEPDPDEPVVEPDLEESLMEPDLDEPVMEPDLEEPVLEPELNEPVLEPSHSDQEPVEVAEAVPLTHQPMLNVNVGISPGTGVNMPIPIRIVPISNKMNLDFAPILDLKPFDPNRASSLDAFLANRQERAKKFSFSNQFTDSQSKIIKKPYRLIAAAPDGSLSDIIEEEKKKSQAAYDFLFDMPLNRKKPQVPKTNDLFDEEHDRYFKRLTGDVGCMMVRKWTKYARRPPDFGDPPYLCDYCGRVFGLKRKMKQHLDHHKGLNLTICAYCGEQVSSFRLNAHILSQHKPPGFACQECGRKFHLKTSLSAHVKTTHKDANIRFPCQVCGIMLKTNSLQVHMRRHNTTKPYICEVCKKVFKNQFSLYTHRTRIHFNTKRHSCQICSKTIKSLHNFKKHMRLHESHPNCHICGQILFREESLVRHLRIAHGSATQVGENGTSEKENKEKSEQEELEEATNFITDAIDDINEPKEVIETQDEMIYESIVAANVDVETSYDTVETTFC